MNLRLVPESGLASMLDRIHDVWVDYVVFPSPHEPVFLALWTFHTWTLDSAVCTPYPWFSSAVPESGKTRALEVAREIVREPLMASTISAAALYRVVEEKRATLLLDEMDGVFSKSASSETAEAIRQVLNAGYRRGNPAVRVAGQGKQMKVETYDTFSAKALAGLKTLPPTLASRCVEIRLHRRKVSERVAPFRLRHVRERVESLRLLMQEWAEALDLPEEPAEMPAGLGDRDQDKWEPLLVIAEAAGGEWPTRARVAALALARSPVAEDSVAILLLEHLRVVFGDADALHTVTILERLHRLDEAPWSDWFGRPFTARNLARMVGEFGVHSKKLRIGDSVLQGYTRESFADVWERYLPHPPGAGTSGTSGTTVPTPTTHVPDVPDVPALQGMGSDDLPDPL